MFGANYAKAVSKVMTKLTPPKQQDNDTDDEEGDEADNDKDTKSKKSDAAKKGKAAKAGGEEEVIAPYLIPENVPVDAEFQHTKPAIFTSGTVFDWYKQYVATCGGWPAARIKDLVTSLNKHSKWGSVVGTVPPKHDRVGAALRVG